MLNPDRGEASRLVKPDVWQIILRAVLVVLFCLVSAIGWASLLPAQETSQKRNPFTMPNGVYPMEKIPTPPAEQLFLEALLTTDGKRIAVINGFNFRKGELAFGQRIVDILQDQVVVEKDGERRTLVLSSRTLPNPSLSFRTRH